MIHNKYYTLRGLDLIVIVTTDNADIVSISTYNKKTDRYEGCYPDERLYQDIKECFLNDDSVGLKITEGS